MSSEEVRQLREMNKVRKINFILDFFNFLKNVKVSLEVQFSCSITHYQRKLFNKLQKPMQLKILEWTLIYKKNKRGNKSTLQVFLILNLEHLRLNVLDTRIRCKISKLLIGTQLLKKLRRPIRRNTTRKRHRKKCLNKRLKKLKKKKLQISWLNWTG